MVNPADALWNALTALPKPVTRDAALACAESKLTGKPLAGFRSWFEDHEDYLLGRLNG